jgi:hypothetical protein
LLYTHTHTRTCWFSGSSGSAYLASKRPWEEAPVPLKKFKIL